MESELRKILLDQASRLIKVEAQWSRLKDLLDGPATFDSQMWSQAVKMGWPAMAIDEELGGLGLGLGLEPLSALLELLGQRTVSLPLVSNFVTASALAQNKVALELVQGIALGEAIATLALPESGDNGLAINSTVSAGRVSGAKAPAPFAVVATHALVSALDGAMPGLYLVELEGVERKAIPSLDNARASAAITFEDAPAICVAQGREAVLHWAAVAATLTAFEQVGGAQRCLDTSVEYAKERRVFGQPIGAFQAIKHKLADMYQEVEIARGCALDAVEALEQCRTDFLSLACAARLGASAAYDFNARECIQTHGGIGVTWEAEPHHHYRRARVLALELGGGTFWRDLLVDGQHALEVA